MYIKEKLNFCGRDLVIESGKIAKQASGSCVLRYGDTVMFVAVTSSKGEEEDRGFFPLSVDFVVNPDLSNFFSNTNLIALSSSAISINGFFIF